MGCPAPPPKIVNYNYDCNAGPRQHGQMLLVYPSSRKQTSMSTKPKSSQSVHQSSNAVLSRRFAIELRPLPPTTKIMTSIAYPSLASS